MQANGAELGRIANQLNADRVPTRKGGRWKKGTLHGILNEGRHQAAPDHRPTRPAVDEGPGAGGVVAPRRRRRAAKRTIVAMATDAVIASTCLG